ncbi:MAG: protoporphyrinogen oxidase [Actinobacteria bacterium]|nr:protoporphyrinogen oxidase [Actinomycetota bacterium]
MGPGGKLTSFADGMGVLIDTLTQGLRDNNSNIVTGKKVEKVEQDGGNAFKVFVEGESPIEADIVILAVPAYSAAEILDKFESLLIGELKKVPYPPVNVVIFGYPKNKISRSLDGFGFLIPSKEKRRILGCLWTSSIFNGQVSEGYVSLRTILGGARNPDVCFLDDNETIKTVQEELRDIMGVSADPTFIKIYRHEKAIPQYVVGHTDFLTKAERFSKNFPGLFLVGNAYRGIGVNDCTRSALNVSRKVINYLKFNRR